MCFVVDADWTARVAEEQELVSDGKVRCDDCFRRITVGEKYGRIDQQEHEECQRCEETWSRMTDEDVAEQKEWCEQEGHDYGETFTHRMCRHCQVFREAISAVEVREGCSFYESQPAFGDIRDSIWDSDHREEYADEARAMDAGLVMSGYLDWMLTGKRADVISDLSDDEGYTGAWCDRMTCPEDWLDVGDVGGEA